MKIIGKVKARFEISKSAFAHKDFPIYTVYVVAGKNKVRLCECWSLNVAQSIVNDLKGIPKEIAIKLSLTIN